MYIITTIWHSFLLLFTVFIFSPHAIASCNDTCMPERKNCQQTSDQPHATHCDEQFNVCVLSCNRQKTMSCVYLGFNNHEGTADREKELGKLTNGFARVTDEKTLNFDGLCRNNDMRCDFVLDWEGTMFSCGGEKREPGRVACCR